MIATGGESVFVCEDWHAIMKRALKKYGCDCNSCCYALLVQERLARKKVAKQPLHSLEESRDDQA